MALMPLPISGRTISPLPTIRSSVTGGPGARFDFTYCPPALVALYEKIGHCNYSGKYLALDEGLRVPMVFVMDDVQHLQLINSPFTLLKNPDPTIER